MHTVQSFLHGIEAAIAGNVLVAWIVLAIAFYVLARSADLFVTSAIELAIDLRVPRLVIGIVLVSLATTAPELAVSLIAALEGTPEMALGNAIGSVICDDGLALAMVGLLSAAPVAVMPKVLKTSGIFLIAIQLLTFFFVIGDNTLDRIEGVALVALFLGYLGWFYRMHKAGEFKDGIELEEDKAFKDLSMRKLIGFFLLALAGILFASEFIVTSATSIALWAGVPESIIALTLVALGTSIPEVATCVTAARKNEGAVAVGNILGADILNICWVAGASAIANPLVLRPKALYFMFPAMFIVVGVMLLLLWRGYRLTRTKGAVLLGLYILYLVALAFLFPPG